MDVDAELADIDMRMERAARYRAKKAIARLNHIRVVNTWLVNNEPVSREMAEEINRKFREYYGSAWPYSGKGTTDAHS